MWWFRPIAAVFAALWLVACGFQPLYGGGRSGPTASELASIRIAPISNREGQLLRNELMDLLTPYGQPAHPDYRLQISLSQAREELAVKKSEVATRANLRVSAIFHLIDTRTNEDIFNGTSSLVGGFNILDSDFSTLVAEDTALKHIITQIARDIQARLAAHFSLREEPARKTTQP